MSRGDSPYWQGALHEIKAQHARDEDRRRKPAALPPGKRPGYWEGVSSNAREQMRRICESGCSVTQKAVLFALVSRAADEDGRACSPSYEVLGAESGVGKRAAMTAVSELVKLGHVSLSRRKVDGRSAANRFTVHVQLS